MFIIVTEVQTKSIRSYADDLIYDLIRSDLLEKFPDDEKFVKCLEKNFRGNKIADRLYNYELIFNQEKIKEDIKPYINEYSLICSNFYLILYVTIGAIILLIFLFITGYCCYSHFLQPITKYVLIRRYSLE